MLIIIMDALKFYSLVYSGYFCGFKPICSGTFGAQWTSFYRLSFTCFLAQLAELFISAGQNAVRLSVCVPGC